MRNGHMFSKSDAEAVVSPFKEVLGEAILGARDDWTTLLHERPNETSGLSGYVRARYVHDRAVFRLQVGQSEGRCPVSDWPASTD